jgi:hypothetical protein
MAEQSVSLPKAIGAPATRALVGAGYRDLAPGVPKSDLIELHGVGPRAIRLIQEALEEQGLPWADLRTSERSVPDRSWRKGPKPLVDGNAPRPEVFRSSAELTSICALRSRQGRVSDTRPVSRIWTSW